MDLLNPAIITRLLQAEGGLSAPAITAKLAGDLPKDLAQNLQTAVQKLLVQVQGQPRADGTVMLRILEGASKGIEVSAQLVPPPATGSQLALTLKPNGEVAVRAIYTPPAALQTKAAEPP
ncbi:MAG: hypothetical protein WAX89_05450, partial [Alphaproteobacteria bacterium]